MKQQVNATMGNIKTKNYIVRAMDINIIMVGVINIEVNQKLDLYVKPEN